MRYVVALRMIHRYELPAALGHFVTEIEPDEGHLLVIPRKSLWDVPFLTSDGRSVRPSSFVLFAVCLELLVVLFNIF